jgi:hypothetical protein
MTGTRRSTAMLERGFEAGRLWTAWRLAADEVWETWREFCAAPRTARGPAYDQHMQALEDERLAAGALAGHRYGADVRAGQHVGHAA